jgi:hypothetical protein
MPGLIVFVVAAAAGVVSAVAALASWLLGIAMIVRGLAG